MKLLLAFFVFIYLSIARAELLKTPIGKIVGVEKNDVVEYLNIPYATPPIGQLRWKAPRPLNKSQKIINNSYKDTRCAQLGNYFSGNSSDQFGRIIGSEDCLYLSIWRPKGFKRKKEKLPVFFWIHGGSNRYGIGRDELYHGGKLATATNAIVISINYRLGHFGAFYNKLLESGNKIDDSGNFVTLDILMALKWVKQYIHYFGGDKNKVTIAGQSAGCINVWGIVQTKLSEGLFKNVLCSSGIPNNYPKQIANKVSSSFIKAASARYDKAFDFNDKRSITKFLYSLSTEQILNIPFSGNPVHHISDGYVFPKIGMASLLTRDFTKISFLIGNNSFEGSYFIQDDYLNISQSRYWDIINGRSSLVPFFDVIESDKYKRFRRESHSFSSFLTEATDYVLHGIQSSQNIYRYVFKWKPSLEPWRSFYGATHGVELPFIFGNREFEKDHFLTFLEDDLSSLRARELVNQFQLYLKGFIHYSDPNAFLRKELVWKSWSTILPYNLVFEDNSNKRKLRYPNLLISWDLLNMTPVLFRKE